MTDGFESGGELGIGLGFESIEASGELLVRGEDEPLADEAKGVNTSAPPNTRKYGNMGG